MKVDRILKQLVRVVEPNTTGPHAVSVVEKSVPIPMVRNGFGVTLIQLIIKNIGSPEVSKRAAKCCPSDVSFVYLLALAIIGGTMIQIPGVLLNGKPFVVDAKVAVSSDGRIIALEDPAPRTRWGR